MRSRRTRPSRRWRRAPPPKSSAAATAREFPSAVACFEDDFEAISLFFSSLHPFVAPLSI